MKRNANALYAVLGNLDTLQGAYKAAEDAAGSAAREQENYAKSIQYSLDRFQATIEKISVDLLNSDFLKGAVESAAELLGIVDKLISKSNGITSIVAGLGAGFGFNKLGGTKGISSIIQDLVQDYDELNILINKYNDAISDSSAKSKLYVKEVTSADNVMGKYLRSLDGGEAHLKGYTNALVKSKAATIGMQLATAALDAAITMGVSLAVTALVSVITKLVNEEKEAREAAVEMAEAYESESKSIDEQIDEYKKLNQQLQDAYRKGEDTYDIKSQLLSLQEELNRKYGDEFDKLNLVNGAYQDQIEILKNLSKTKAEDFLATNDEQFDKAFEYLDKIRNYDLGELVTNSDYAGIIPILNKYGIDTNDNGEGFFRIQLKATIEDADQIMTDLYADLKEYEKTHKVDLSFITESISNQKQKIDKDDTYDEYRKLREQYINATIAANNELSDTYEKGVEAVEAYNEALESKEGVRKAKANLDEIRAEIENTEFDEKGVREKFLAIFDGIDDDLEKRHTIDEAFASKSNDLMKYAERLKGLTDIDLTNLTDTKTKASFNYLLHTFGLTEKNAGLLIDKLVELGIVTRGLAKDEDQLAESQRAWATERDAALDKLKLRKETSSGVEYDEEWTNYLEVMKELNPQLRYNQEELEKYALANMQFSKGVEDLSKNFKTYKEALKDADEVTPEYSNAITALADDLTYLTGIHFSIEEAADFLSAAKNVENLEKAINGSDEALKQLQADAKKSVKITLNVPDVASLYKTVQQLEDIPVELKLDPDEFYTQFYELATWLETADLGSVEAKAYLDNNPFIQALVELASQSTEMAEKIKKVFDGLGWNITWDTTKMKVPKAGGSHTTSIYAPTEVRSKYANAPGGAVTWEYQDMDVPTNIHFVPKADKTTRNTSTSSYTPSSMSSAQKSNAATNIDKANKSGKDSADKFYDYFERLIKKLDNQIDMLDAHLEDVVGSAAKNTILDAEENIIQQKLDSYSSAIQMYSQEASNALAKIPSDIAEKLINGAIDVDTFVGEANEDVYEAIQNYTKWAEKVEDCQKQLVELKEAIRQLELQKFNNLLEDFNNQIDLRQSSGIDLISKQIDLLKEAGQLIGESFYQKQIELTRKNLATLEDARSALAQQMNEALDNGIDVGSDEWLNHIGHYKHIELLGTL